MIGTPKSLRLHIGIFGRTNTGKSSFLNMVTGQDSAIVSATAGTTTDVVQKSMELLPLGPVVFLDTAGIDDSSELGSLRIEKTRKALASSDIAVILLESGIWTEYEQELSLSCVKQKTPLILVINKIDISPPNKEWIEEIKKHSAQIMLCSCAGNASTREAIILDLKRNLLAVCPEDFLNPPSILGDLLPSGKGLSLAVLIVPIDLQAPKGRLILPQVQSIRDCLDSDASVAVVKEKEYPAFLQRLSSPPDLVVCDSQIALKMVADTPASVNCTTFSILFSRYKGNITLMAEGAAELNSLEKGDSILISESCTHHALEDDIGRVKIPRWIRQFCGVDIDIDHYAGKEYPENLEKYRVIIHCGGCSLSRREMLWRIEKARASGVPVTNYGMAISVLQGVVERTLSPFPGALEAYQRVMKSRAKGGIL